MNWIKCCDKMPKEGDTVICYNGIICTGFFQNDYCPYEITKQGWNLDLVSEDEKSLFGNFEVTHWMPLPKKPR